MIARICLICILLLEVRSFRLYSNIGSGQRYISNRFKGGFASLCGKSRMPTFSEDDEEELKRIMEGRALSQARPSSKKSNIDSASPEGREASVQLSSTLTSELMMLADMKASGLLTDEEFSLAKAKLLGLTGSPTGQLVQESIQPTDPKPHQFNGPIQTNKKTIPTPNKDWRNVKITSSGPNALSKRSTDENSFDNIRSSYNDPIAARTAGGFTKSSSVNDDQDIEFDYADFESAMFEEEGRGMYNSVDVGSSLGKNSVEPTLHEGLTSGEVIVETVWDTLVDAEGKVCEFEKVHRGADIIALYCDPRRMTSECRIIISEFKKVPLKDLALSLAVINCDDFNDHRKFLKKNSGLSFPLLSDPSKAMMDVAKCRANKRIASALMLLEMKTGKVIKIWYENDWDALTTKDLLIDELKQYRKNPIEYLQNQIGLR